jgi:DNA-binding transcriptional LysR family regulator
MELRHLRHFVTVAQTGQVSAAAQQLYLSQPALSQSLRHLERELGVELLARHPRGVALTAAGGDFLIEACAAVGAADRAMAAAAAHRRVRGIGLSVGYLIETFELLVERLGWLDRARPDIRVDLRELSFANQERALRDRDVDIALLHPPPADLAQHLVHSEPIMLAMHARHPLAARDLLAVDDIADEVFAEPVGPKPWVDRYLLTESFGQRPRTTGEPAVSPQHVLAQVLAGGCVVTTPAFLAARYARGNVVARTLTGAPAVAYGFAWTRATPAVQAFVEVLRWAQTQGEVVRPTGPYS